MSRTYKDSPNARNPRPRSRRRRDISVRAVRRDPPDVRKLSRALITLALAEAAASEPPVTNTSKPAADESAEADNGGE